MSNTLLETNWDLDVDEVVELLPSKEYQCGEYHRRYNPHTGKMIWERWYCRKYHVCPICQALKQKQLSKRISPFVNDPQYRVIVHNQEIAQLNNEHAERLHIPSTNGVYYSIVKSDDSSIGQPLTSELASEIASHAVAPKGKRISGNLGRKSASPKEEEKPADFPEEVKRRVIRYCHEETEKAVMDKDLASKIEAETEKETADLDPKTADQVQEAIYIREQKLVEVAARYKVEILFLYTETILVYQSQINWKEDKNNPTDREQ